MSGLKQIPYIKEEDVEPQDITATKCAQQLEFKNV